MVVAGYMIPENQLLFLNGSSVIRDSKTLTPSQRNTGRRIPSQVPHQVTQVQFSQPAEIDRRVRKAELNILTIEMVHNILHHLLSQLTGEDEAVVILDSLSSDTKLYETRYNDIVDQYKNAQVKAYTKADSTFKVVSAASVIAKYEREKAIQEIQSSANEKGLGDFGSGYPSDTRTTRFLQRNWGNPYLREMCRQSWATWSKMAKKVGMAG